MAPRKFWMVWANETPPPQHRHPSYCAACKEADRVASLPNRASTKVYVLEAMDYRWVQNPPLTKEIL